MTNETKTVGEYIELAEDELAKASTTDSAAALHAARAQVYATLAVAAARQRG